MLSIEPHLRYASVGARRRQRRDRRAASTGTLSTSSRQKARVKPPLEPAKRELTTLLKIDPNE